MGNDRPQSFGLPTFDFRFSKKGSLMSTIVSYDQELETIEIQLLLEGIFQRYGYDCRNYAPASLRRRIWNAIRAENLKTVSALQDRLLHDNACMERFLLMRFLNLFQVHQVVSFVVFVFKTTASLLSQEVLLIMIIQVKWME